jgi:O-antigen/teichoic acid export membrane protein
MDPDVRRNRPHSNVIENINSGDLLKNITTVSLNSIIIAVINLAFHFIMSRRLGPEQYGELETLLTINTVVLITLTAVCLIVTRFVSYYRTRQQYDKMKFLANWAFMFFFLVGMAAFIINIVISRMVAGFLNIPDYSIMIIFGLLIWISFLVPIIEGILRGLQEFNFVGRYKLMDAVLRLAIGGTLVIAGLTTKPVILGLSIGACITLVFSAYRSEEHTSELQSR